MKLKIVAGTIAGFLALSACSEVQNPFAFMGGNPPTTLALQGGAVVAGGAEGICVDTRSSAPSSGFAVLAPCATLQGTTPTTPVLGTIQVGAAASASVAQDPEAFAAYVSTQEGSALLSQEGDAKNVSTHTANNAVIVLFEDTGTPPFPGILAQEARAFLDINDRLVTVAFRGLSSKPISLESVRRVLEDTLTSLRTANAPSAATEG